MLVLVARSLAAPRRAIDTHLIIDDTHDRGVIVEKRCALDALAP
jgi:hypothetical protein